MQHGNESRDIQEGQVHWDASGVSILEQRESSLVVRQLAVAGRTVLKNTNCILINDGHTMATWWTNQV